MRKGLLLVAFVLLAPSAQAAERPQRGFVRVPLDRLAPAGPRIRIGYELYRRRDRSRPSLGTATMLAP